MFATASTTSTVTALPHILYLCVSDIVSSSFPFLVQLSGKPCSRSHSIGVNLLILFTTSTPFGFDDLIVKESWFSFPIILPFLYNLVFDYKYERIMKDGYILFNKKKRAAIAALLLNLNWLLSKYSYYDLEISISLSNKAVSSAALPWIMK